LHSWSDRLNYCWRHCVLWRNATALQQGRVLLNRRCCHEPHGLLCLKECSRLNHLVLGLLHIDLRRIHAWNRHCGLSRIAHRRWLLDESRLGTFWLQIRDRTCLCGIGHLASVEGGSRKSCLLKILNLGRRESGRNSLLLDVLDLRLCSIGELSTFLLDVLNLGLSSIGDLSTFLLDILHLRLRSVGDLGTFLLDVLHLRLLRSVCDLGTFLLDILHLRLRSISYLSTFLLDILHLRLRSISDLSTFLLDILHLRLRSISDLSTLLLDILNLRRAIGYLCALLLHVLHLGKLLLNILHLWSCEGCLLSSVCH